MRPGYFRDCSGGNDTAVIELNRAAFALLRAEKVLVIVPGATHLFEEPGALDEVEQEAREWFLRYLTTQSHKSSPAAADKVSGRFR